MRSKRSRSATIVGTAPRDRSHAANFASSSLTMASARAWHHDRELVPLPGGGTRVVDEIGFEPRIGAFGGLQAFVFQAMFRWRHRRLRGLFGQAR